MALGLAFQVIDDILDVTQSSETLGKSAGKDLVSEKATYPSVIGLEESRKVGEKIDGRSPSIAQAVRAQGRDPPWPRRLSVGQENTSVQTALLRTWPSDQPQRSSLRAKSKKLFVSPGRYGSFTAFPIFQLDTDHGVRDNSFRRQAVSGKPRADNNG